MPNISCEDAEREHGITCEHERFPSGELRFRLKSKRDETAYIRTEAPPGGAWQQSHYHNKVKETFIVQAGWIGYAELHDGAPRFYLYRAGEMFTTPPEVIHNVYMSDHAVIHTVKHGEAIGEARLIDKRTKHFDSETSVISEVALRQRALPTSQKSDAQYSTPLPMYSEAYRHFDNLIWQVPVWTTAIFAVVLAGMTQLTKDSSILSLVGLDATRLLAVSCGLFGVFTLVLSHALYRFRWHQVRTKSYTPLQPLSSPQVYLQLLVNVEALVLLFLAAQGSGLTMTIPTVVLVLAFGAICFFQERKLIQIGSEGSKPIRTES